MFIVFLFVYFDKLCVTYGIGFSFGLPCGHLLHQSLRSFPFILSIWIGKQQYRRDIYFKFIVVEWCLSLSFWLHVWWISCSPIVYVV